MNNQTPWYKNYPALRDEVENLSGAFISRCGSLGLEPVRKIHDFGKDIVPFWVRESDWEKDHSLVSINNHEALRSNMLKLPKIENSRLDMRGIVEDHFSEVVKLKKDNASNIQIGAYNLSKAYKVLWHIRADCISRLFETSLKIKQDDEITPRRVANIIPTGEFDDLFINFNKQSIKFGDIHLGKSSLMDIGYIQFLYQIVFMGVEPFENLGLFNRSLTDSKFTSLIFALPSDIPIRMNGLINEFPVLLDAEEDSIQSAARISFRFIKIHPYTNGNGRISRLLMNLVLLNNHPPVCLKADRESRHRYNFAINRATQEDRRDNANIEPLTSLICLSLIESYKMLLDSLS